MLHLVPKQASFDWTNVRADLGTVATLFGTLFSNLPKPQVAFTFGHQTCGQSHCHNGVGGCLSQVEQPDPAGVRGQRSEFVGQEWLNSVEKQEQVKDALGSDQHVSPQDH